MHELAISETICKIIEKEAKNRNMEKVRTAKLKIGVMNAFQRENLDLCLKDYAKNPLMAEMQFVIEEVPVKLECTKCNHNFTDDRFADHDFAHKVAHAPALYLPPACPTCKCESIKLISGNEMKLVSIEA
ncbi:MAG: hydrogenase maturation nickel metallochaperone HypA [Deltaproteobacteria bacterium]|nr:hydrogenase maturation nickel metallochaperone HypA [Deltaproteobacteria bacterium]